MLDLLTKYLLQYRTVTVPQVGTIHLVQQPAQLNIAEKIIYPPSFFAELKKEENVSEHQLHFLNAFLHKENDSVEEQLKQFGDSLYDKINGPGFDWIGLGRFDRSTQSFAIPIEGLHAITAERVIRENPDHQVLVGDRQTSSYQIADEKAGSEFADRGRSVLITVGWILLGLSILAIAFFIYQGKFRVNAAGSKQSSLEVKRLIKPGMNHS